MSSAADLTHKRQFESNKRNDDKLRLLHGITKEPKIRIEKSIPNLVLKNEADKRLLRTFGITHEVKVKICKINKTVKSLKHHSNSGFSINVTQPKNSNSNKPNYECNFCKKTYSSKNTLSVHLKSIHQFQARHHFCSYPRCKYLGLSTISVKNHMGKVHNAVAFRCVKCDRRFNTSYNLMRHEQRHSKVKQFKCSREGCEFSCHTKSDLTCHQKIHLPEKEKPYQCITCGHGFANSGNFKMHKLQHYQQKEFKCKYEECDYKSYTSRKLKEHTETHHSNKQKLFRCNFETCQKTFAHQRGLKSHLMASHIPEGVEKKHKCQFCKYGTQFRYLLQTHMRLHTGEKPFKCKFCEYSAAKQPTLRIHLRTHTGEKPFFCSYCKKDFREHGQLNIHMRTHTGEKPYSCSVCEKTFIQASGLKKHILRMHTAEKPFSCEKCDYKTATKDSLKSHIEVNHERGNRENSFSCTFCPKAFYRRKGLTTHLKIHSKKKPVL